MELTAPPLSFVEPAACRHGRGLLHGRALTTSRGEGRGGESLKGEKLSRRIADRTVAEKEERKRERERERERQTRERGKGSSHAPPSSPSRRFGFLAAEHSRWSGIITRFCIWKTTRSRFPSAFPFRRRRSGITHGGGDLPPFLFSSLFRPFWSYRNGSARATGSLSFGTHGAQRGEGRRGGERVGGYGRPITRMIILVGI